MSDDPSAESDTLGVSLREPAVLEAGDVVYRVLETFPVTFHGEFDGKPIQVRRGCFLTLSDPARIAAFDAVEGIMVERVS